MQKSRSPYAPGSQASGVEWAEAANVVWYRRSFDRPDWSAHEVLLNIGACDYTTDVYLNGHHVCHHQGGYTPSTMCRWSFPKRHGQCVGRARGRHGFLAAAQRQAGRRHALANRLRRRDWHLAERLAGAGQENYGRSIFSRYDPVCSELKVTLTLAEQYQGSLNVEVLLDGAPCDFWAFGIYQS